MIKGSNYNQLLWLDNHKEIEVKITYFVKIRKKWKVAIKKLIQQ